MALSISVVWEVRGASLNGSPGPGADTNGGGFVAGSGGTDRSMQNAAQVTLGVGVTSSITTTVVTFTGGTYTVLAGDVGNIVQFISGTNVTAGFYQITAVSAGLNGTWTLDRTPLVSGTTTNAVANMGGALLTLGKLSTSMTLEQKAFCTGSYTATAGITFAQNLGGAPSGAVPATHIIGYGTTRGDATHASLTLTTNTGLTGITLSGQGIIFEQIDIDCGSLGTSTGILLSASFTNVQRCKISNFTTRGISGTVSAIAVAECELTGGGVGATTAIQTTSTVLDLRRCFIHDNACPGVILTSLCAVHDCLIVNNSGASSDGIQVNHGCTIVRNTIHNQGRHGINNLVANIGNSNWRNNILSNNGGFGIVGAITTAVPAAPEYDGNAYFSNTSGNRSFMDSVAGIYSVSPYANVLDVTLSVSPYVGPTTGTTANFALNNTAGAGAACRAMGSPSTWPGNTGTTSYPDMGAVQTRGSNTSPSAGGSPGVIVAVG